VDDWALYEPDGKVQDRLLEIARQADPGKWTDRLRTPVVLRNKDAVAKLAAARTPLPWPLPRPIHVLGVPGWHFTESAPPSVLLTAARARHPTNFDLAFALGFYHVVRKDDQAVGSLEAARALRPDNAAIRRYWARALKLRRSSPAPGASTRKPSGLAG